MTANSNTNYAGNSIGRSNTFKPVAGLRTVVCPIEVVAEFLKISNPNTLGTKIETCAILAGEERNGELHITTLIVPK